jgi:hypothetical protein
MKLLYFFIHAIQKMYFLENIFRNELLKSKLNVVY